MKAPAAGSRRWKADDTGDLTGRTAVVTGASAGIGLEIARVLADHGALVVLACRNASKSERAAGQIRARNPAARLEVVGLDLARQASVRTAAAEISARYPSLDLLINNAGVMEPPYEQTEDGFELTLATNHLGHFALTGLVLDRLLATPGSRVVTAQLPAGHGLLPVQAGQPAVHLRAGPAPARGRGAGERARRPPRRRRHRPGSTGRGGGTTRATRSWSRRAPGLARWRTRPGCGRCRRS